MRVWLRVRRFRKPKQLSLPAALAVVVIGCGTPVAGRDAGPDAAIPPDTGGPGADAALVDSGSFDAGGVADAGLNDSGCMFLGNCDCGITCACNGGYCSLEPVDGGDGGLCQCLL